jgi:S1-C subfamily serine protease
MLLLILALLVREERAPEKPITRTVQRRVPKILETDSPKEPERRVRRTEEAEAAPLPLQTPAEKPAPREFALPPWRPGYMGMMGIDAPGGGALVTQVFPYTAAAHAGLREGDIVLEFNGRTVSTLAALFESARNAGEGMPIILRVRRAGTDLFLGLQLGRHPQFN